MQTKDLLFPFDGLPDDFRDSDPDDRELESLAEEEQLDHMRQWFLARYEDPVHHMPYHDGQYTFVWGGPFDPHDVIQNRFGADVPFPVMQKLIQELWSQCSEWAPREQEPRDYDEALSMLVSDRSDPRRMLSTRLQQISGLLAEARDQHLAQLTTQLAHGATITALESYLWDTATYWVMSDDDTLRRFVATNTDFQKKTFSLASLFERHAGIKQEVELYLQNQIWHRLDKVKQLMEAALEIDMPPIGPLMYEVLIRHDVVHRGGRTKSGESMMLSSKDVQRALDLVAEFSIGVEREIDRRYEDWDEIPF